MLPQTARYAIRAMAYIAANGSDCPVLAKTISEEMKIPLNFLSKILNRLTIEGVIKSFRGKNGGFVISGDAKRITLYEIANIFVNLENFNECFMGHDTCVASCSMHDKWVPIHRSLINLLKHTSIDQVFHEHREVAEIG